MIEIKNVSFTYPSKKRALNGVSFDVEKGKLVGLLGPNGGGKTTLFKIISSLIRQYEGEVFIDGINQKKNLLKVLPYLGVVFQSPSLDRKLTVEENLVYQANLYGFSRSQIRTRMNELMDLLFIRDRKDEMVDNLSGGLARRVEIVKSLLHSPKILLMDEPSTGLDIQVRIELWNLLKKIQNETKTTILMTTHFIEEADRCDRIHLISDGKIISSGTPTELKKQLAFKYFQIKPKNFLATQSMLNQKFGVDSKIENEFIQFRISPDRANAVSNELASEVEELTYRDPSLEDVFVHHAGRKIREIQ